MQKSALGKGLSALIPENFEIKNDKAAGQEVQLVDVKLVQESSIQPRLNYDQSKIDELKDSIIKNGVLQPILVREKEQGYEVIAGERRLRAAREASLERIPVVVRNVNNQEALVLALVENIQREELNPIEEAHAFEKLIRGFQCTQEDVAQSVGKDRSTISNLLRLLSLPEVIQKKVSSGLLSMGHARALLGVEDATRQRILFESVLQKGMSVRELENLVRHEVPAEKIPKKPKNVSRNHELVALEEDLQRVLGTKVRLHPQQKRGKIVIEYYSLDDLERILQIIKH